MLVTDRSIPQKQHYLDAGHHAIYILRARNSSLHPERSSEGYYSVRKAELATQHLRKDRIKRTTELEHTS